MMSVLGFLSHLHSLMVTMSQKSSVPQAAKSVSQALMSDTSAESAIAASAARAGPALPSIVAAANISTTTFMSSRCQMNCSLHRQSSFGQTWRVMVPPDVETILLTEMKPVG